MTNQKNTIALNVASTLISRATDLVHDESTITHALHSSGEAQSKLLKNGALLKLRSPEVAFAGTPMQKLQAILNASEREYNYCLNELHRHLTSDLYIHLLIVVQNLKEKQLSQYRLARWSAVATSFAIAVSLSAIAQFLVYFYPLVTFWEITLPVIIGLPTLLGFATILTREVANLKKYKHALQHTAIKKNFIESAVGNVGNEAYKDHEPQHYSAEHYLSIPYDFDANPNMHQAQAQTQAQNNNQADPAAMHENQQHSDEMHQKLRENLHKTLHDNMQENMQENIKGNRDPLALH